VPLRLPVLSPASQESKAGLAVGKLRSHAAKEVSELAKEIVRMWKTAVDKEKQAAGTHSKGAAKAAGVCANWLITSLSNRIALSF
jgi:hypothetical protein